MLNERFDLYIINVIHKNMKKLAAALTKALRESDIDRGLLLSKTTIKPTALSRYLNAKAIPTPDSLVQIMAELPEKQALEVFSAYIKETLPPSLAKKISIKGSAVSDDAEPSSVDAAEDDLNDSIELLRELARDRKDIRTMLINLCDALKKR